MEDATQSRIRKKKFDFQNRLNGALSEQSKALSQFCKLEGQLLYLLPLPSEALLRNRWVADPRGKSETSYQILEAEFCAWLNLRGNFQSGIAVISIATGYVRAIRQAECGQTGMPEHHRSICKK